MNEHPFALPESTAKHLKDSARDEWRPAWERYANTDFTPDLNEWPHTIEVFREWYRRNSGVAELLKETNDAIRRADGNYSEKSMSSLSGPLNLASLAIVRAFDDFEQLVTWAITAWEFDPLICELGKCKRGPLDNIAVQPEEDQGGNQEGDI